jgi:hypothetical protein
VREVPDVLKDPLPDVLPWEFKDTNVNLLVRWWRPQRAFEVRTRAGVMFALKQAAESAGILPADTKLSFAQTPLITAAAGRRPKRALSRRHPARPSSKRPRQVLRMRTIRNRKRRCPASSVKASNLCLAEARRSR